MISGQDVKNGSDLNVSYKSFNELLVQIFTYLDSYHRSRIQNLLIICWRASENSRKYQFVEQCRELKFTIFSISKLRSKFFNQQIVE